MISICLNTPHIKRPLLNRWGLTGIIYNKIYWSQCHTNWLKEMKEEHEHRQLLAEHKHTAQLVIEGKAGPQDLRAVEKRMAEARDERIREMEQNHAAYLRVKQEVATVMQGLIDDGKVEKADLPGELADIVQTENESRTEVQQSSLVDTPPLPAKLTSINS